MLEQVSGSYALRVVSLLGATLGLLSETLVRQVYLLARDGELGIGRLWRGWRSLARKGPHRRALVRDYLAWFRRDFHPSQIDDRALIAAASEELAAEGFATP